MAGDDCSMRVLHKREAGCQMSAQDTEIVLTVPAGVQFLPTSYLGHTQLFQPAKTRTDLSWVWRPEHVGLSTDSTQTMWCVTRSWVCPAQSCHIAVQEDCNQPAQPEDKADKGKVKDINCQDIFVIRPLQPLQLGWF